MVQISKIKHILILLVFFPVVFYFFDLYKDNLLASEHQFLPYLLSSTIGRNKNFITSDIIFEIINGMEELLNNYKKLGINIISTGG